MYLAIDRWVNRFSRNVQSYASVQSYALEVVEKRRALVVGHDRGVTF